MLVGRFDCELREFAWTSLLTIQWLFAAVIESNILDLNSKKFSVLSKNNAFHTNPFKNAISSASENVVSCGRRVVVGSV